MSEIPSSVRLFRCTQKVIQAFQFKKTDLIDPAHIQNPFNEWYCNFFNLYEAKHLIFTHPTSLYSFVVPENLHKDCDDFNKIFTNNLKYNLEFQGYSKQTIAKICPISFCTYGKTKDKSVLGSMSDLIQQFKWRFERSVDENISALQLNHEINRIPLKSLNFYFSQERFKKIISNFT